MSGTIELLEAIGSDASLRYAATEELMRVLERARADAGLVKAVAGDCSLLDAQFARRVIPMCHVSQTAEEDDEPGEVEEEESPVPREPKQG